MKLPIMEEFYGKIQEYLQSILDTEGEHIGQAARLIADWCKKGKVIHIYGPGGHSAIAAQEIFGRAGGLACMNWLCDVGTMVSNGGERSMMIERLPGYGNIIVKSYGIGEGDLLILVNAYGINAALIGAALEAKARGATLIGVSSKAHAEQTPAGHPARHPTKKNLHDLVDVHVDTKIISGDAVVHIEGVSQPSGAMSTFCSGFATQSMVLRAIELLRDEGIEAPVIKSGNAPGGDEWNRKLYDRYGKDVRFQ